jgi:hypothetical protein
MYLASKSFQIPIEKIEGSIEETTALLLISTS